MNNFRSIDFWKASIMTLPDNAFFELLRTVFGKIKTPFSKQTLIGDLEKFLLRKDIQKNIAGYIDDSDIRIITAVAALNEPAPAEMETFFAGELSYAELYDLLINLEERFILYRFVEKEHNRELSRLALNPVLESILSPLIADTSLLFSSVSVNEAPNNKMAQEKPSFLLDDRILAALLSFVSRNKMFFRGGGRPPVVGGIRQKVLNAAKPIFNDLPLENIIGGLQVLGLFLAEDETLVPDYQRFTAFGDLSRQERLIYCVAGIWCYIERANDDVSLSPWLFRSKARAYAEIISRLYDSLDTERLYPQTTLQKMIYMLEYAAAEKSGGKIINMMEKAGLIIPVSEKYWRKMPIMGAAALSKEDAQAKSAALIAMDTPFTLLVYPEVAYNDAITLAAFSDVVEAGMTVRFEMSRDSVVLAFNRGLSADTIVELLRRLSHNRIDENLLFTLHDWEKRHREVTLRRGLILTLAPEQHHLAETRSLAKLIVDTLAPGIYMLPESAEEKAVEALRKAGVAIIARQDACRAEDTIYGNEGLLGGSGGTFRHFFQPLSDKSPFAAKTHTDKNRRASRASVSSASALTDQFHSVLNQMRHGKEERDELAARIDRRLVLCESQLHDAVIRYEKLEARGLDYVGKAMIAKQAISMQMPVEVVWGKQKQQERVFGIPRALEKVGSESILIIDPLDDEDSRIPGNTLRLSLGKISLLRRIKKSIFEV